MTSKPEGALPTYLLEATNVYAALEAIESHHRLGIRLDAISTYRSVADGEKLDRLRARSQSVDEFVALLAQSDSDLANSVRHIGKRSQNPVVAGRTASKSWADDFGDFLGDAAAHYVPRDSALLELHIHLQKRSKNNVILCAPPGSGKTALVEYYAEVHGNTNEFFRVDVPRIVAGTKNRGDLEARFSRLFSHAESDGHVLFVDEIHALAALGSAEGGLNVLDMLKPYLVKASFRVIGATTPDELGAVLSDRAFRRRFSILRLTPMTGSELREAFNRMTSVSSHLSDLHGDFERVTRAVGAAVPEQALLDSVADFLEYLESCRRLAELPLAFGSRVPPTSVSEALQHFAASHYQPDETVVECKDERR